jgi:universal stress protein G
VRVRSGNVRHELLALADEVEAELIVVGHRSHGTVRDAILGSVAASIVHHSRRSVLVAVPPA